MKITKAHTQTLEIRETLSELIGEVTVRNLFSGYGLYKEGLMFGLFQNNIFYVKAEGKLAEYVEACGAVAYLTFTTTKKLNISSYYRLPLSLLKDKVRTKQILMASIQQIKIKKTAEALAKKERIKELPNLSVKHERLLAKIGITSIKQFKECGSINAFIQFKKSGLLVNANIFWALTAALLNKHVYMLTEQEKARYLEKINALLNKEGFKRIK